MSDDDNKDTNTATDIKNHNDNNKRRQRLHVVVIVLGDLGRSPRMQYHALSLLEAGHDVTLIGYVGESLIPQLIDYTNSDNNNKQQKLSVVRMTIPSCPLSFIEKIRPLYFLWRIVVLSLSLLYALFWNTSGGSVDCLLVQNPPALPLLFVSWLYCQIKGMTTTQRPGLVIDWHNLGYSMLSGGLLQRIARTYETAMAPLADGHLCVTNAMKEFVQTRFLKKHDKNHNNIQVLHDCPPDLFQPLTFQEQHEIMMKLHPQLSKACSKLWLSSSITDPTRQTLFTEQQSAESNSGSSTNTMYRPRVGRPALITSSTSWTPDEDFGVLLDALVLLDQKIINSTTTDDLKILVVVTGKGPEKEYYIEKISKLALEQIAIQTVWLEPSDYPKLLACADVGISLHTSTSGLDLPMKILDLFGCQTPVCAINFSCLDELVRDRFNGRVFSTSNELSDVLFELLSPLAAVATTPSSSDDNSCLAAHGFGKLKEYSRNLEGHERWKNNWDTNALPVLLRASSASDEGECRNNNVKNS